MKTADLLQIPVAIVPDRTAVIFEGKQWTFAEFAERVDRLTNALDKLGIGKGDRVAIMATNCNHYVEVYYATSKLGAIFVPLNYRARVDELEYLVMNSEPEALILEERYALMADSLRPKFTSVNHYIALFSPAPEGYLYYEDLISQAEPDGIDADVNEDDTTILMYTAGTTGVPKGVILSHGSFLSYALSNVSPPDPMTEQVNLLVIPFYHVAGLQGLMASIYGGRTLVIQRQFVADEWLQAVQDRKVTHSVVVPTMLKMALDVPEFGNYDLSSLQQITYGAAPMPFEVIKNAIERMPGVHFINAFGQTETASTVTALASEDHEISGDLPPDVLAKRLDRLARSIGKALPDTDVRIFNEDGNELPTGQEGEIWARGPRVMSGYWKMPGQTAATKTTEGWIRTGDIGLVDEEGYFYLTGRAKDIIIRGGENISPEEVENVLYSHPAVDEAAVIGVPDVEWGENVRGVVVLKKGQTATAEELLEHCRSRIASFKRPTSIVFVDELPRNPMGKILKRVLREEHGQP